MNSYTTLPFPKRITLELTNHCNLHCVFCPRRFMEKETGFLDVALARELMSQMHEHLPVTVVPFFRGESLTHPQWHLLLASLHEFGLGPIQMATNASLLTEEKAHKILEIGIDTLSFSMDTLNPNTYRRLRGTDYAQSLENVLRFLELRRTYRKARACGMVQVSAVKTKENAHELDDFIAFWRVRVDRVRIYPEHSTDGKPGSLSETIQAAPPRTPCAKVFEEMVIYWNGEVALCNHDWTRRITKQHIASVKTQSIQDIWNSPAYEVIRRAHAMVHLAGIAPCEHCQHWRSVSMGDCIEGYSMAD